MSISTYAELQTSVATWLHRTDLTALIPDFITLAESRMSADINARAMAAQTVLTTVSGNAYVTLPSDMVEMHRLVLQSDPYVALKYVSADELTADYPTSQTGRPAVFAVIGGKIQLAPIPDSAYSVELTYRQKIPALSSTNTSNWLLMAWPDAYLYATLCAAQPFMQADDRIGTFNTLYQTSVAGINSIDWYSGSTMRVKAK